MMKNWQFRWLSVDGHLGVEGPVGNKQCADRKKNHILPGNVTTVYGTAFSISFLKSYSQ